MPGVPDFYQGTEFWDLSLVDPDNRRPVDFAARATALAAADHPDWDSLVRIWPNGHLKLAWTRHLLKLRTELADVFTQGDYQPLRVSGPHRDHVIAFARRHGGQAAIVAVAKAFAPCRKAAGRGPARTLSMPRSTCAAMSLKTSSNRPAAPNCGSPPYSGICRPRC